MSLTPGRHLGPYEILAAIGAKLHRDVAAARAALRARREDHGRVLHGHRGRFPRRQAARVGADQYQEPSNNGYLTVDLHPDGRRLAVMTRPDVAEQKRDKVVFVFNLFDELRRVAPIGK